LTPDVERLEDRDWRWWMAYVSGRTQTEIARAEDPPVDQSTVSRALERVRAKIPEEKREDMVARSLAMLLDLQAGAVDIYRQAPAPVFVGKDGDVARDPENGNAIVRDYSGKIRALESAVKVNESVRRLLGLDAAQKLDLGVEVGEARAAEKLAEEARARLAGETGEA
jgi:hypothetical protein